ncbi:hypothetical protein VC83_08208 [Pseudogymnoascus destructans]|uniref:Uncharacterized protein n=1 Tax=Pseudogymnoascus destructans TaxID=655981 RepID=A0A177A1B5_9PEZI|nr:uncharacterized protein VC83_08208 [Pseudogymnoascus destructans]OAF55282.1 hypothetical protein VC83_08208 [Pseudogymnoascus destructans]
MLFGFKPRFTPGDLAIDEAIRKELIEQPNFIPKFDGHHPAKVYAVRMAKIEEMRDTATEIRLRSQQKNAEESEMHLRKYTQMKRGDLVLLRRLSQDNNHSHKLEPRWLGPYILHKLTPSGKSAFLQELHSDQIKGKFHLNDLKLFVSRKRHNEGDEPWEVHFKRNEDLRKRILREQRLSDVEIRRRAALNREQGIPFEEEYQPQQPDLSWWDDFIHFPADTADEHDPRFWENRGLDFKHL